MNFSQNENFVVLECVNRLLDKGYNPENIFLEASSGNKENRGSSKTYLDILIKDNKGNNYLVLELKTRDDFDRHWNLVLSSGGQLFNYFHISDVVICVCIQVIIKTVKLSMKVI